MSKTKFKKGAASFYIVAFSTLILLIIAASFSAVIISELTRTSNDDLSQSAYDSALAGVEDGKLAFYNYRNCVNSNASVASGLNEDSEITCGEVRYLVEKSDGSNNCDMVGRIVGRDVTESGVEIKESDKSNNMQQFYTCTKINTILGDIRGTLTASSPIKVVRAKFENGVDVNNIKKLRISWFSTQNAIDNKVDGNFRYTNISGNKVSFGSVVDSLLAAPPTISLTLVQASGSFDLSDFDVVKSNETNRGMLYMVPTSNTTIASGGNEDNYIGAYQSGNNFISADGVVKSNDKTKKNLPYVVYCAPGNNYACSATIELPNAVGGTRSADNFMFAVALPYGAPGTDFSLEFFCADGAICHTEDAVTCDKNDENCVSREKSTSNQAYLSGVQIEIDSTGRANDLYRRVQARLEAQDNYAMTMMGPLELLTDGSSGNSKPKEVLRKDLSVTSEWNFNL